MCSFFVVAIPMSGTALAITLAKILNGEPEVNQKNQKNQQPSVLIHCLDENPLNHSTNRSNTINRNTLSFVQLLSV